MIFVTYKSYQNIVLRNHTAFSLANPRSGTTSNRIVTLLGFYYIENQFFILGVMDWVLNLPDGFPKNWKWSSE